ncbi:nitrogenase stabilizing/protective protein NifW [Zavarzinia compransoris]|uniref:nitrogenase stabilizing/protective protein NifW n=1 Tax=Zavarzinia marina TaxID=2911065 RepID=UPI001F37A277|nr:nitrogenase stabilizing/protective protein NifW [Zavarzinia marina]MCF4164819.1 nitrogenase stabilizing/protective protein NifW [Zavarzinia marina]
MSLIETLKGMSTAEDFFDFLAVPYDQSLLRVARLHILRRMGDYLRREDLEALSDDEIYLRARADLERAYADFQASTPLEQRVFKVLKDAVRPKGRGFVPLSALEVRKG